MYIVTDLTCTCTFSIIQVHVHLDLLLTCTCTFVCSTVVKYHVFVHVGVNPCSVDWLVLGRSCSTGCANCACYIIMLC